MEIDQDSHKNYNVDDEKLRMKLIRERLNKKTIFIRFNPDIYGWTCKDWGDKCIRPYNGKLTINVDEWKKRSNELIKTINGIIDKTIITDLIFLFYDKLREKSFSIGEPDYSFEELSPDEMNELSSYYHVNKIPIEDIRDDYLLTYICKELKLMENGKITYCEYFENNCKTIRFMMENVKNPSDGMLARFFTTLQKVRDEGKTKPVSLKKETIKVKNPKTGRKIDYGGQSYKNICKEKEEWKKLMDDEYNDICSNFTNLSI